MNMSAKKEPTSATTGAVWYHTWHESYVAASEE